MKKLFALAILLNPIQLLANAETETAPKSLEELDLIQVIAPLFMVIVLIFILAWMVKKMNRSLPAMGKDIEVLASTPLSSQSRLCLIRVAGKDMLIGVTPGQISHLQTFDQPVIKQEQSPPPASFSEQFSKLLTRKN